MGFSLDEVRTLLALSIEQNEGACSEVREVAANRLADIRAKIADLQAMERVLSNPVRQCDAGEASGCPLIDTLSATRRA